MVTELSFTDLSVEYLIQGNGTYTVNTLGEASQQLSLDLNVSGTDKVLLDSGTVKIPVPFPPIEITVSEDGQRDAFHKYTIKLVPAPHTERVLYELVEGSEGSFFLDACLICERP